MSDPATQPNCEVEAILKRRYPSFAEPLKTAWTWNRQATNESVEKAHCLLTGLKERYPCALPIRYELALCLVKSGRREEALAELRQAAKEFAVLDEDTLCLWGRIHKDQGDKALRDTNFSEAGRADDNIWVRATEAEARLLLQQWDEAAKLYKVALAEPIAKQFHCDSMRAQAQRIIDAFQRLHVPIGPAFTDVSALFVLPAC